MNISRLTPPSTPDQLQEFAETLDSRYEFISAASVIEAAKEALIHGRRILRDCYFGSAAFIQTAAALGMLAASEAAALFDLGQTSSAWSCYNMADKLLNWGGMPAGQLWVRGRQIIYEVLKDRAVHACVLATEARQFAAEAALTDHPTYVRLLVQAEARALILTGQIDRAEDVLVEAADLMKTIAVSDHIGLNQTRISLAEFNTSMATRYNEIAAKESAKVEVQRDYGQAAAYAVTAWPDLDRRGATGLQSYVRLELARTLVDDDPAAAAGLLVSAADFSQHRPVAHLIGQYQNLSRVVADRDVRLGRTLADRLREWRQPG
jgi:hypothetical protein